MSFSEIYREAGRVLRENLGKILVTMICYSLITMLASGVIGGIGAKIFGKSFLNIIPTILLYVVTVYFSAGLSSFFLKLARGEDAGLEELLAPRPNIMGLIIPMLVLGAIIFAISFGLGFLSVAITFGSAVTAGSAGSAISATSILSLVATILLAWITLGFSQITFIYLDGPEYAGFNTLGESWEMMKGNKLKLFILSLGFVAIIAITILILALITGGNPAASVILVFIVMILLVVLLGPYFVLCLCYFYDSIRSGRIRTRNSTGITEEQQIENIVEEIGKDARGE